MKANEYRVVFMFSGQGSHYRGMGKEMFESNIVFKEAMEFADAILRKTIQRSLISEVYEIKRRDFDDLFITHPAIVSIELSLLRVMEDMGIKPDLVVGCSLGEFASGVVAGAWSHEDAIKSSIEQAKAIESLVSPGGMSAVLSKRTPGLMAVMRSCALHVASGNFADHFTVSGLVEGLSDFESHLDSMNITYQRLDVKYPFHCPYMDAAKIRYMGSGLPSGTGKRNSVIMYSSFQGRELTKDSPIDLEYFWGAVSQPFEFGSILRHVEDLRKPCLYIDLGPSGTMGTFVKYNLVRESYSRIHTVLSPFKVGIEKLQELQQVLTD